MSRPQSFGLLVMVLALTACSGNDDKNDMPAVMPLDPATAKSVHVDRFSDAAGHLQKRSDSPSLPGPDEAVDFDQGPFITEGFGPGGEIIKYYNFDVQPTKPAPIYVPMKNGKPVDGQLNIVGVIPGDKDYNDFWQVVAVSVPDDYVANTLTSVDDVDASGYDTETTDMIVNCPIVPQGSTASLRGEGDKSGTGLTRGWYQGELVHYFNFGEKEGGLKATGGRVPISPIYVTFNDDMQGPASGFKTENDEMQTHNVAATLPTSPAYSPLWAVTPYPSAKFDSVSDLASAATAAASGEVAADVNCPIVSVVAP
ncbi:MAG TPA: hypothetical protein VHB79_31190 [Polyangiaceae bacterium]|nr:hypothetical protein [Polyangiaceae bacterium]